MNRFMRFFTLAALAVILTAFFAQPGVLAKQYVDVNWPNFKITMNDVNIDNYERLYPIIVYRDITYVPMTYSDSRFLGLETKWSSATGLEVNKSAGQQASYNPNKGPFNANLDGASVAEFRIRVNGKDIDNQSETYPLLVFRDVTYFPLTWRFMVNEFGWTSNYDAVNGLVINSKAKTSAINPVSTGAKVYSQDFGGVSVIFDRTANNKPGNLYVKENNITKKIGNPNYIYGVGYLQAGKFGEYTAVDKVEYANRWVYTLAINPAVSPIDGKNVRINIDTNEVQNADGSPFVDSANVGAKIYSQDFGGVTVIFDRTANNQPGNLYVKENNITKKIGNPNYIYGVGYLRAGTYGDYSPVDKVEYANRWVYTLAVDPAVTPITSRNVKINIDTNEVQAVDDNNIVDPGQISSKVFTKEFNGITVIVDRASNRDPGNLYVKENNIVRRVGNPKYIYGVAYIKLGPLETYNPVDNITVSGRYINILAIDPAASPIASKSVKVNIDTNEVQ